MNKDEEQADGAQVIDEFDLSEADSSIVDEDQGLDEKTNLTEDRENSETPKKLEKWTKSILKI